jgi:hypothetical protein
VEKYEGGTIQSPEWNHDHTKIKSQEEMQSHERKGEAIQNAEWFAVS